MIPILTPAEIEAISDTPSTNYGGRGCVMDCECPQCSVFTIIASHRALQEKLSAVEQERGILKAEIVAFLWTVFNTATHGSSGLMERAIQAIEAGDLSAPDRVAFGTVQPKGDE